jgi:hypothetical protein
VTGEWWNDDDALLAAVRDAIREAEDVPPDFVEAGRTAFAWHNIDAELAALTYDSLQDALADAEARSATEPAELRCLIFDASELSIELEIIGDTLRGQLGPPQPGDVELRQASGPVTRVEVNDVGHFSAAPVPAGSFRLYCRTQRGQAVLTDWIRLADS